jgi:hypothetical protein
MYYDEQYYADRTANFRRYLIKTYGLMSLGLALTFVTALLTALFLAPLTSSFTLAVILLVAQVIVVIAFSRMLRRARFGAVVAMFVTYAILTGVSISYIFALYDMQMIVLTFAAAAISFAVLALLGFHTRQDLSSFGRIFLVGVIGLLLLSIVGYFLENSIAEILISCLGLILFLGVTAYDSQSLRRFYEANPGGEELSRKLSVYFAMQLYLDFINIFVYLLRLFGRSSRNR